MITRSAFVKGHLELEECLIYLFHSGGQSLTIFRALFLIACALLSVNAAGQKNPAPDKQGNTVQVRMRNVMYHFTDEVAVHIKTLRGELVPLGSNEFPVFDDKESFRLRIAAAEIAISARSMASVLNSYVFTRPDAPLKDISIRTENGRLKLKGKLHGKGNIPFETDGILTPTSEGKIRLHLERIKALHLPVKGLMDLLGIDIGGLIKTGKVPGVQTEKGDLILDPQQILPPPHVEGIVTDIRLEGDTIVQIFGRPEKSQQERIAAANYMAYRGNRLRFGSLTMTDADMILIDMNPNDPFDFSLDHYKEHLEAGYAKITPSFGLRVFMRDFEKVRRREPAKKAKTN